LPGIEFLARAWVAVAALYQEQILSYKHLDEPLDEGRFVFECILAGNPQAFAL